MKIWDTSRFVSFDTETHQIQDGLLAPPLVVGSTAWRDSGRTVGALLHPAQAAYDQGRSLLTSDRILVGANIAFDMVVLAAEAERRGDAGMLPLIGRAYAEERVFDVLLGSSLEAMYDGTMEHYPTWDRRAGQKLKKPGGKITTRFSLEVCADIVLGRPDAKKHDFWKRRYAVLERVPLQEWPEEARQYPVDDAVNTLDVAFAQVLGFQRSGIINERGDSYEGPLFTPPHHNLEDMAAQVETAFWEEMGAAWGLRTDPARVGALEERASAMVAEIVRKFTAVGLFHEGAVWSRCVCGAESCTSRGKNHWRQVLRECPCGEPGCAKGGKKNEQALKRRVALAYGVDPRARCQVCQGWGRVLGASGSPVYCEACDGTGLDLSTSDTLPRTDKGAVGADRDALMESGDEVLHDFGDNVVVKIQKTYLPFVKKGVSRPITLSPNPLLASGRTAYDELIQLFPRQPLLEGGKPVMFRGLPLGVRQCARARDGYLFLSVDYSAIELCCFAQVCLWRFGHSRMADIINETMDPGFLHSVTAARMIGVSNEEMRHLLKVVKDKKAKENRQASKPVGFGVIGGMGGFKIVYANRKAAAGETEAPDGTRYAGIRFCILVAGEKHCGVKKLTKWKRRDIVPTCQRCLEVAEYQLRPTFLSEYPEAQEHLDWSNRETNREDEWSSRTHCLVPASVRACGYTAIRGGVDYSSRANNQFQRLNADGTKAAVRAVGRECYGLGPMGRDSPLWGTRPIMMVHDEIFAEVPEERAHEAAVRMTEVMVGVMRQYLPDVYVGAEPALGRWWSKEMEARKDASGRLIPWDIEAIEEERRFLLTESAGWSNSQARRAP